MYAFIVRRRVRGIFAALSRGDAAMMLDALAPRFVYRFDGDTALGGERRTREAMERWWARLFRLLPGIRFDVHEILVTGFPWRTQIAVRMTVHAPAAAGGTYLNPVMQFSELRWGRLHRIQTLEDTLLVQRNFERLAEKGVAEALAEPIRDAA